MSRTMLIPAAALPPSRPMPEPAVFLDGVPDPAWRVVRFTAEGALDERSATLRHADGSADASALAGRTLTVALPLAGIDGGPAWRTLLVGTPDAAASPRGDDPSASFTVQVRDAWSRALDRVVSAWPVADAAGGLTVEAAPALRDNRSAEAVTLPGGVTTHVPGARHQPWTLGAALMYVLTVGGIDLPFPLVSAAALASPLTRTVELGRPLRDVLAALLTDAGLVVCREPLPPDAWTGTERRDLRPASATRFTPIAHRLRTTARSWRRTVARDAAQRVVLTAGRVMVEGTFTLRPQWDASRAGAADTAYHRTLSPDFATYANVYRRWVLNEDGAAGAPPFDAAALFGVEASGPGPVTLAACLTRNDVGEPRPVSVEVSLDGGSSWQPAPTPVERLAGRVGVYLAADDLGAPMLAAGAAGTLGVRLTGTLVSPGPRTITRAVGNPFRGGGTTARFDAGERFAFRRVDASSIHAAAVAAGDLTADERWDEAAFHRWAVEQADTARRDDGRVIVTPEAPWPGLWLHDRLDDGDGRTLRVVAVEALDDGGTHGPRATFTLIR